MTETIVVEFDNKKGDQLTDDQLNSMMSKMNDIANTYGFQLGTYAGRNEMKKFYFKAHWNAIGDTLKEW